jgi:ribonuclease HI
MAQAKKGATRNQLSMPGMTPDDLGPPEWQAVEQAVAASLEQNSAGWAALAGCRVVEAYTDGSAPVRNPGGPTGSAAVMVGFASPIDQSHPQRPPAQARLELGAYVEGRKSEPRTSNNRAEIAAMMMALETLYRLEELGHKPDKITIWSDSEYTIRCMNGSWQRKKNTDLWPQVDLLAERLRSIHGDDFEVKWVKGHAGNEYNEIADELATRAAFNFSQDLYTRYRAAQQESGKELPGQADLARHGLATTPTNGAAPDSTAQLAADRDDEALGWQAATDYTLAVHTRIVGTSTPGHLPGTYEGQYQLWSKDGSSRAGQIKHSGLHTYDEASYLTLTWAANDLARHITAAGGNPADHTLTIYTGRELIAKQIAGVFKVKAENLKAYYEQARRAMGRFKSVQVIWKQGDSIKELFRK